MPKTMKAGQKAQIDSERRAIYGVEVFRSGRHPDSSVPDHYFAPERLAKWAEQYNAEYPHKHRAPATNKHPKEREGAPALGWASNFTWFDDPTRLDEYGKPVRTLVADFVDFWDPFFDAIRQGFYRERSIGLRGAPGNETIDHVAWLGAELPAVKGLAPVFHEADEVEGLVITFTSKTQEGTDMAVTKEELEGILKNALTPFEQRLAKLEGTGKSKTEDPDEKAKAKDGKKAEGKKDFAEGEQDGKQGLTPEIEERLKAQEDEIARLKGDNRKAEFREWLGKPEVISRLTEPEREGALNTLVALDVTKDKLTFSEGGKSVERTAVEQFQADILKRPVIRHTTEYGHDFAQGRRADGKFENANDPQALGAGIADAINPKSNGADKSKGE